MGGKCVCRPVGSIMNVFGNLFHFLTTCHIEIELANLSRLLGSSQHKESSCFQFCGAGITDIPCHIWLFSNGFLPSKLRFYSYMVSILLD